MALNQRGIHPPAPSTLRGGTVGLPALHEILSVVPAPREVTVVLANEDRVVLEGLRVVLADAGITITAEARSGDDALRQTQLHRPDVLLLDPRMYKRGVTTAISKVAQAASGTAILVFTVAGDDGSMLAAIASGARGYLLQGSEPEEIIRAVLVVAAGGAVFCSRIADLLREVIDFARPHRRSLPQLTPRENEILELVADGLSNSAIARRLGLASKTVSNNISAIFGKLRVSSRSEAIAIGRPS